MLRDNGHPRPEAHSETGPDGCVKIARIECADAVGEAEPATEADADDQGPASATAPTRGLRD